MANYKKFITLLLIFSIHMMPFNSAWASTSLGGWTITSQIAKGASLALSASKTAIINGASVVKTSTAKITPNVSQVAKVLRGGAYGYAISVAVEQILGKSVDWLLDPANNQITYTDPDVLNPGPTDQFDYGTNLTSYPNITYYSTKTLLLRAVESWINQNRPFPLDPTKTTCFFISDTNFQCTIQRTFDPPNTPFITINESAFKRAKEIPVEEPERKAIPLPTIAAQVISNAESHPDQQKKAGAQSATTAAAQDMLANDPATQSDVETQLNTNAKTQTSEQATGNTKPNEANPEITDISLTFPAFCSWAPSVCEAANVVINFPTTLTDWWNRSITALTEAYDFAKTKVQEFSDIFKDEPQSDTELEFNDPTDDITDTSVSFSSSCPQPIVLADFNFHGIPIHWELDFSAWCDSLSTYLKPIVIAMASFSAVLILGGVRENV